MIILKIYSMFIITLSIVLSIAEGIINKDKNMLILTLVVMLPILIYITVT